jgi:hypothetical protein
VSTARPIVVANVLGIFVEAMVLKKTLPFSVGLVEGRTLIGDGWPLRFRLDQEKNVEVVNRGTFSVALRIGAQDRIVAPGESCILVRGGFFESPG